MKVIQVGFPLGMIWGPFYIYIYLWFHFLLVPKKDKKRLKKNHQKIGSFSLLPNKTWTLQKFINKHHCIFWFTLCFLIKIEKLPKKAFFFFIDFFHSGRFLKFVKTWKMMFSSWYLCHFLLFHQNAMKWLKDPHVMVGSDYPVCPSEPVEHKVSPQ